MFQTLIGTVKRKGPPHLVPGPDRVSNPHRYGQKDVLDFMTAKDPDRFKPS